MRARNVWIIAGIAAMAVIGWYFLRGKGTPSANPDRRAAGSASGSASGSGSGTREPTRSIPPTRVSPPRSPIQSDDGWGDRTEGALRPRLEQVLDGSPAKVTAIECGTGLCRITVDAPDDEGLSAAISLLETPEGLSGFADQMIVDAPEDTDDGGRRLVIDAVFEP